MACCVPCPWLPTSSSLTIQVAAKLDAKTAGRIAPVTKQKVRVNADFAEELQKKEGKLKKRADKAKRAGLAADEPVLDELADVEAGQGVGGLLNDSRFSQLFDNADYRIDTGAEEYLAHHAHMRGATAAAKSERVAKYGGDESDDDLADDGGGGEGEGENDEDDSEDDEGEEGEEGEQEEVQERPRKRAALSSGRAAAAAAAARPTREPQMYSTGMDLLGAGGRVQTCRRAPARPRPMLGGGGVWSGCIRRPARLAHGAGLIGSPQLGLR